MYGKCGELHHNYGKPMSEEQKIKISETLKGRKHTQEELRKMKESHLDKTQADRKASETIKGEKLDLLLGTVKIDDKEEKDPVKANILKILKDQCNIEEDDFLSAEFEVVPAGEASFVGLDKSMVGGYGQDDRVCAWTSLMALIDVADF